MFAVFVFLSLGAVGCAWLVSLAASCVAAAARSWRASVWANAGGEGRGTAPAVLYRASAHPAAAERAAGLPWRCDRLGQAQAGPTAPLGRLAARPLSQACANCAWWAGHGAPWTERLHAAVAHVVYSVHRLDPPSPREVVAARRCATRMQDGWAAGPLPVHVRVPVYRHLPVRQPSSAWQDLFAASPRARRALALEAQGVPPFVHAFRRTDPSAIAWDCRHFEAQCASEGFQLEALCGQCLGYNGRRDAAGAAFWGRRLQASSLAR